MALPFTLLSAVCMAVSGSSRFIWWGPRHIVLGVISIWIRYTQVTDMVSVLVWKRFYFILFLLLLLEPALSINISINGELSHLVFSNKY